MIDKNPYIYIYIYSLYHLCNFTIFLRRKESKGRNQEGYTTGKAKGQYTAYKNKN